MATTLQPVRGTHDLLPEDFAKHKAVADLARHIGARYGYAPVDTPIFEFTEVFHRTLGDTSDVVSKETYTFTDRGGESLTLRPEFTAAIVRSFISNGQQQHVPCRYFYHGPAFRYERPQKGRMRQFHQIGCELLGAPQWQADVEMIALARDILEALGIAQHTTLELNTLGDSESRAAYRDVLVAYFKQHEAKLSEDSKTRLAKNPLRILDSKAEEDKAIVKDAPRLGDHLNETSREFFTNLCAGLDALGISYRINDTLVRGLDYYNHTVFEFTTDKLGAQGTVLAGGRYDALVATMGGPDTAGIGFAAGVERLSALRDELGITPPAAVTTEIAIVPLSDALSHQALKLAHDLRGVGYHVDMAYSGNAGKRFKRADKLGAALAIVLGDDEHARGEVTFKHLGDGTQRAVKHADILTELANSLKAAV